uniref:VWFA domain-containing protein n=1 Tax=Panagrolaimus davidi TaxID=227884 RepID=A0A914QVE3_9BILA
MVLCDNATVTVPLKQYSRTDFLNQISYNISYGDGGDSNVTAALSLAFDEFSADGTPDENGYHVPRLIVLVVNDISQFGYKNTVAAMDKLKTVVQFPTGVIIPGIPGIPSGAQDRLAALIGNENYTFGSLDSAATGIPTLTNNLNCPFCSNLIFICEMTVAIGYDQKLECLKLAQKLASVTADNEKKRYAIGTYGVKIYNNIQLQTFSDFNETINKLIDTVTTDNQPNGGQTYLASAIRDPNPAMTAARKVASLFTDIYVLDESRIGSLTNLWPTLTNNLPGHIVNGTVTSDNDSLFATFNTTLLQDYRQIQC